MLYVHITYIHIIHIMNTGFRCILDIYRHIYLQITHIYIYIYILHIYTLHIYIYIHYIYIYILHIHIICTYSIYTYAISILHIFFLQFIHAFKTYML